MSERRVKTTTCADAVSVVKSGQTIVIGGSLFHNKPMALIRELVRSRTTDLTVIGVPQASIDVDMLIATGQAAEIRVPYFGFDQLGLAPAFRQATSAGTIRVWECDETQLLAGLEATAKDLPSGLVKAGVGTDLPRLNPDLHEIADPITGEPVIAVAAIRPDVALLHAPFGDKFGNLFYPGYGFADQLLAEVTKRCGGTVIASVDEIVPTARAVADPHSTGIAHFLVDAVVEAPFGAHPCSSHGNYLQDATELERYLTAVNGGAETLAQYLDATVFQPTSQEDYLDRTVKPSTLVALRRGIHG